MYACICETLKALGDLHASLFAKSTGCSFTFREVLKVLIPIEDDVKFYCIVASVFNGIQVGGERKREICLASLLPSRAPSVKGPPVMLHNGTCGFVKHCA